MKDVQLESARRRQSSGFRSAPCSVVQSNDRTTHTEPSTSTVLCIVVLYPPTPAPTKRLFPHACSVVQSNHRTTHSTIMSTVPRHSCAYLLHAHAKSCFHMPSRKCPSRELLKNNLLQNADFLALTIHLTRGRKIRLFIIHLVRFLLKLLLKVAWVSLNTLNDNGEGDYDVTKSIKFRNGTRASSPTDIVILSVCH